MSAPLLNQRQQYEPPLRFMITGLEQAMMRTMGLPSTNYAYLLDEALKNMQQARDDLRSWAAAHDIEVHAGMPT